MTGAPTITLTTDFGQEGPFVGVMKGVILTRLPGAQIVDLTHAIHAHWPAEAGFWLSRSWSYFPEGTVHVAVVDPGVGTARDIVAAEMGGHTFLAPDNGLLPLVLRDNVERMHRLDMEWLENQNWLPLSPTFHGRDIIAPLAANIASGTTRVADIGPVANELVPCLLEEPMKSDNSIQGTVIAIDHFGNLITNIDERLLESFNTPEAQAGGKRFTFHRTYGQRKPGEFMALINSFGVVEISRVESSAADSLGLGRGAPVLLREAR
ncbi:MAG: SAM-dependent chlorinase/fluorinase [Gammaproteobacteria bacterium]|jgi:hypothetical protein|nr:SAM-dependent chlorinase/fluorinase [Gammaproteobacteria bacterium]MDP7094345.1 SAM-dependent chlorinase/fluorinase [Gammaproteobacteria bacterium]HJP05322.1 SAM-dependent chlorinase/fluorinase [Gammaproteobacteria bacterium]